MKQLKIRLATKEERPQIEAWSSEDADPKVLDYPTATVLCAYNGSPVAYLPMQKVLMLEATAISPDASELESAQALRDLFKGAELTASVNGIKEIYFLGTDTELNKVAEHQGIEKLPWTAYRMKL